MYGAFLIDALVKLPGISQEVHLWWKESAMLLLLLPKILRPAGNFLGRMGVFNRSRKERPTTSTIIHLRPSSSLLVKQPPITPFTTCNSTFRIVVTLITYYYLGPFQKWPQPQPPLGRTSSSQGYSTVIHDGSSRQAKKPQSISMRTEQWHLSTGRVKTLT